MIAFLFPGQGSQYPGMMCDIARAYPRSREVFDMASDICGRDILALCEGEGDNADKLSLTENTQPCLAACELAALRALESHGVRAELYGGFSLGEWTASVASGALSYEDMFRLIKNRARFMQEAVPAGEGAMAAVLGCGAEELEEMCKKAGEVWISSYNCEKNITLSGKSSAIDALGALAEHEGFRFKRLNVSVPSHCPLMEPAARRLGELMENVGFSAPSRPLAMNADGRICDSADTLRGNLLKQLVSPMRFEACVKSLLGEGADVFIEIGPGHTLSKLVSRIAPEALILRAGDIESLRLTLEALEA